jgi:uncharacterized protein
VLTGACAFGACYGAASIARHVPPLDRAIRGALRYEHHGSTPLVLLIASANAVAEELFFRGALWALVTDSHPVVTTTLAYAAVTATTGNPALVLAGSATSVLFGLQRRSSGNTVAPALSSAVGGQRLRAGAGGAEPRLPGRRVAGARRFRR